MDKCPFCGGNMANGKCTDCGYTDYHANESEIFGEAVEKESKIINEEKNNFNNEFNFQDKQLGSLWKVIFVIISIFFSGFLGLIISIVLLTRPYPSYRSFGKKLLILNIILIILSVVFGIFAGVLSLLLFGAERVTNHMDGTVLNILRFM